MLAALRKAPNEVKKPQPMIADSSYSSSANLLGSGKTAVCGTTAYSARPPNEYMATGSPSVVKSRVVSSYKCPFNLFKLKNGSQVSSSPFWQKLHVPQGMINGHATFVPNSMATPSPQPTTSPLISCPNTAGCGNGTSALMQCKSVWHTPQLFTFTSTSPFLGCGIFRVSIFIARGSSSPRQTTACIVSGNAGEAANART
mmetsp:Transcript_67472/g.161899  ORF Transcript_67472/g.161899 Transcript_67472/m.161899 type:complete len:200 (+) Transcript_67472:705-1304(+)